MQQQEINLSDLVKQAGDEKTEPAHLAEIVKTDLKSAAKPAKKVRKPLLNPIQRNIVIGIVALIVILAFPAYLIIQAFTGAPTPPSQIITNYKEYFESANIFSIISQKEKFGDKTVLTDPSAPRTKSSPINGVLLTDEEYADLTKRLPVAVMINNHVAARPQSSHGRADLVFEAVAESGITRYMAVYWSTDINKVGPIRSARQYYLEWLSPFDAIYLHDGYASSLTDPRVDAGGNMYIYDTKSLATYGAWRENDGVRVAPHNEYTSPMKAWDRAEDLEWGGIPTTLTAWKFKKDLPMEQRGDITEASVVFDSRLNNGGLYDVEWEYDISTNSYLRRIGGKVDIDQETATQVAAKVVIIQQVKMTPTYNEKAHNVIETIGEGEAYILQDGQKITAKWKKNSRVTRTQYFLADGKEVEFNRGLIWVMAVPKDNGSATIGK